MSPLDLKIFLKEENKVLRGSQILRKKNHRFLDRTNFMIENMHLNKVYHFLETKDEDRLNYLKKNYADYRKKWLEQSKQFFNKDLLQKDFISKKIIPLSIDIEVSAMCDLACPFCYRETIVTPDKIIDDKFCYDLIDQASELGVPSIKFNWRGEPLLHPRLHDFIRYSKKKGILDTIINTNATHLTPEVSSKLIEAGLDHIIYSFDGGTKKTYEKMRPGRFEYNKFEDVMKNIKNFDKLKKEMNSKFPYTKIQMILTNETINEIDEFFNNFLEFVDDVSVIQYTERGGNMNELNEEELKIYKEKITEHNLSDSSFYIRDLSEGIKVSKNRLPCEQPFQRLMITYEGRVAMCCMDWGAIYPVGYCNNLALNNSKDYKKVIDSVNKNKKGFELLSRVKLQENLNSPDKSIKTIKEIWYGEEIHKVRTKHCQNKGEEISICKNCSYANVHNWV
jgi:MoaA/NifB/PqqE/SkfB family radical SAM enzyme